MSAQVKIGARTIGLADPVFLIAEAGVNHNGFFDQALALVEAAAGAGADAVKFQTFDAAALASAAAPLAEYQRGGAGQHGSQVEMLRELELTDDEFARIAEHCRSSGVEFLSTPFDERSAALLVEIGVAAFKVGSGELTNLPFLAYLAAYGLPLLLSTGMATLDEVADAVEAVGEGKSPLVLLHCVSSYPAPAAEANLRALQTMHEHFPQLMIGYSDHCLEPEVSLGAVGAGARVIERHLTLDRSLPGPDHAASSEPDELGRLFRAIRVLEPALGDGVKQPQPSELNTRVVARRSLVAARDLEQGTVVERSHIAIKRPGGGIGPGHIDELVGRPLIRPVAADEQFGLEHFGGPV